MRSLSLTSWTIAVARTASRIRLYEISVGRVQSAPRINRWFPSARWWSYGLLDLLHGAGDKHALPVVQAAQERASRKELPPFDQRRVVFMDGPVDHLGLISGIPLNVDVIFADVEDVEADAPRPRRGWRGQGA